jgi:hypothetical protein
MSSAWPPLVDLRQPPTDRRMTVVVLCMHTSPLAQPGTGDGGGMNVYVRELATSLARTGVRCEVYTRADDEHLPGTLDVLSRSSTKNC